MISLQLDMVQYDCPYIDTTVENDVSFYATQWDFHRDDERLETRIVVRGADDESLDNGLSMLSDHERTRDVDLLERDGEMALLHSRIEQTDAMRVIREHGGYITGPFDISEGSEIWHVGFDRGDVADAALSELSRNNEYTVESRESLHLEDYYELMGNVSAATSMLAGVRVLSETERDTLRSAVSGGYFETPRDATLSTLADEFDISKMAVSQNLRRGQRKLLGNVVDAMDELNLDRTSGD
jgi:predicted DNA binding protein